MWYMCAPEVAPGKNAPQGIEKVHYECRIDIKSIGGNNILYIPHLKNPVIWLVQLSVVVFNHAR